MKIRITRIKELLKKAVEFTAEHAFWIALLLSLLASILGSLVFYKYGILAQKIEAEQTGHPLLLDERNIQGVLNKLNERELKFQEADSKEYQNPFIPKP